MAARTANLKKDRNKNLDPRERRQNRLIGFLIGFILTFVVVIIGVGVGLASTSLDRLLRRNPVEVNAYANKTQVGVSYEKLGTVERYKPVEGEHNEGLTAYPTYGSTLRNVIGSDAEQVAARDALIAESAYLASVSTWHNSGASSSPYYYIDKDGYLFARDGTPSLDSLGKPRQLYKHTAATGMYLGNVSDDEPGVIKKLTYRKRSYSSYYCVTGLYAPAGEVIKVQMSEEDMEATGGITIHIGQALYNSQANNIWAAKNAMNRMPVILNTLVIDKTSATLEDGIYTAYIGSYFGGPIYVRDEAATFSVTISGAVNYSHYILGVTTEEEFNEYKNSSAPYFDLEVWESGVLHSGPKYYAQSFDYEDISKAAVLWEKISIVSSKVVNQGVVFIYDPFVAAGAAVAFPGRRSVNCPAGWMSSSLNYNSFVTSGAWGNMHEYHHNFQTFGVGYTGEVTNNSLNLVSYSLFTKISSARQLGSYGGAGLSGWNCYTSAPWVTQQINTMSISTNGLAVYATLLHNFGQDAFISTAKRGNYFNHWANVTHQNFSYFADLVSLYAGEQTLEENDYPMFVPVSCVYQTGRSYMFDGEKRYVETMQPYRIPAGQSFTVDLSEYSYTGAAYNGGSVVIAKDFTYRIKEVRADNINGTFVKSNGNDYLYTFTPNGELRSGKIYITIEIIDKNGVLDGRSVDDVDLVLEFEQSYEFNKGILERNTYTFTDENMYTDPTVAFENHYAGYETTTGIVDNDNYMNGRLVQNANSEIWNLDGATKNTIMELSGKLYISQAGDYRIALRGRHYAALYLSFDEGKTYELAVNYVNTGSSYAFNMNNPDNYYDTTEKFPNGVKEDTWIYFKVVLIVDYDRAFVGVGIGELIPAQGIIDEDGNFIQQSPPTCNVTYANAYRANYQFTKEFESEYFYVKDYYYSYIDNRVSDAEQTCINSKYEPWDKTSTYEIGNLFDNDDLTFIHSNRTSISASNPFAVTVKLSKDVTANRLTFVGSAVKDAYKTYLPKTFKVWISSDGENWQLVADVASSVYSNLRVNVDFDNFYTFSYYKVEVTDTHSTGYSKYICLNKIELSSNLSFTNGKQLSPDDEMFIYKGNWQAKSVNSNYGHVNVGEENSTLEFSFAGTRFAVISSKCTSNNYEVYVDGKKVNSFALKEDNGDWAVSYLSPELNEGNHKVVIKCNGTANIDSIVLFEN